MKRETIYPPSGKVSNARRHLRRGIQAEPPVIHLAPCARRVHRIVAMANVGWGNTIYVRGEGGNLSWDVGIPMTCEGPDRWVFSYFENDPPKTFKFLLNDTHWALGENQSTCGDEVFEFQPHFPPC